MILGTTLGIIYIVLLVVFGILCFRKGHWVLGPLPLSSRTSEA